MTTSLYEAKVFVIGCTPDKDTDQTSTNPRVAQRAALFFAKVFFACRKKPRMSSMEGGSGSRGPCPFFLVARYRLG